MKTLSDFVCPKYGWNPAGFLSDIERGHRLTNDTDSKRKQSSHRPIFVRFHSWKTAQQIKSDLIKGHKNGIHSLTVSQLYSKETTAKQNALLRNKENCWIRMKNIILG